MPLAHIPSSKKNLHNTFISIKIFSKNYVCGYVYVCGIYGLKRNYNSTKHKH